MPPTEPFQRSKKILAFAEVKGSAFPCAVALRFTVRTIVIGRRKRVPVPLVLASLSGDTTYQELTFRGSLFDWILVSCLRTNSSKFVLCQNPPQFPERNEGCKKDDTAGEAGHRDGSRGTHQRYPPRHKPLDHFLNNLKREDKQAKQKGFIDR